jgi:GNAT superfamily N-acetyltransferase
MNGYTIAAARERDLGQLAVIELAAATLLTGHAPDSVLKKATSRDVLENARRDGHLWVVLLNDAPVGFALVEVIEPRAAHLEELDVSPEHGRRGLGTRLVRHVCEWAAAAGCDSITLTTFRDVPWNMPFYARLGFQVVTDAALSSALRVVVEHERRRGLDPSRRVVMRKRVAPSHRADAGVS